MLAVLSLLTVVGLLVLGLYAASFAWGVARQPVSVLPFESGMLPQQHAVSRYHVRWYAVTILFLAFDMEMIFMYPWAVVVADMGTAAVVEMFGFLVGKLAVFAAAWDGWLAWLVVLAAVNTVASLFYYLRWIAVAATTPVAPSGEDAGGGTGLATLTAPPLALHAAAAASVLLGVGAGMWLSIAVG